MTEKTTEEIHKLVENHLEWAMKLAHKYKGNGLPWEDIRQEAYFGLMIAAEKYDPDNKKGAKFITYATPWILKYIKKALGQNRSIISQPSSNLVKNTKIRKAIDKLDRQGIKATTSEVAKLTGYSEKVVKKTLDTKVNGILELDKPIGDGNTEISNIFDSKVSYETPFEQLCKKEGQDDMRNSLDSLSDVEKQVLTMRFVEEYTLQEIGNIVGKTPAGVSAIIKRAIRKAKENCNG